MKTLLAFLAFVAVSTSSVQAAPVVIPLKFETFCAGCAGGWVGLDGLGAEVNGLFTGLDELGLPYVASWAFVSGPLVSVTAVFEGGENKTRYVYEDGVVNAHVDWTNADGSPGVGTFDAPVSDIVSVVREDVGGDGPLTIDRFRLGAGLFSAELASLLGVKRRTLDKGQVDFFLELIDGDIDSARRTGTFNFTNVQIKAEAVPEPASTVLILGGLAAVLSRRRAR